MLLSSMADITRFFHALGATTVAVVVGGACGGSANHSVGARSGVGDTDAGSSADLPCDVDRVLSEQCRKCHSATPRFGAPMALESWDDLQAPAASDASKKVYEVALTRIDSDRSPMPPPPNARLRVEDRKTLTDWAAAGAPRGHASCAETKTSTPELSVRCTPDLTLAPSEPWIMPTDAGDEYVCWGVDLTKNPARHITAFAPKIDNTKIVHHVVLYEAPSSFDPKPAPCSSGGSLKWRMVLGWAPGTKGLELPPEAGFPIATTGATHYVVQMHYSNPQKLVGERDASTIELCTEPPRPNEADVIAFGTQDIKIPPHPPEGGVFKRECSVTVPDALAGLHLFASMPHMHKLGVTMSTVLVPKAGGPDVDLGTATRFDFNAQTWLPLRATSAAGDVITTTCGWVNNTGEEVRFGEKTADEMCYSFTMYYPRASGLGFGPDVWSWAAPALLSSCK